MTAHGIGGGAVRALSTGTLEAWVSTVDTWTPAASAEAAGEHDAVVTAALATGRTPLPARFGQLWPSDVACATAIEDRAGELAPLVASVAGLVEMTVFTLLRAMPASANASVTPPTEGGPGRAHLERLRARADRDRQVRARLEALRARVSGALGPLSRGEVAEIRESGDVRSLSVSYLIARDGEAPFRHAVARVARDAATRLVVAGPRAPYSFAPGVRSEHPSRESLPGHRS